MLVEFPLHCTGLLLRSRFRSYWLPQRSRNSDPPLLRSRPIAPRGGGRSSVARFPCATSGGATIHFHNWGGGGGYLALTAGRNSPAGGRRGTGAGGTDTNHMLEIKFSWTAPLGGTLDCRELNCWSALVFPTSLEWCPRSRPGQRSHWQGHKGHTAHITQSTKARTKSRHTLRCTKYIYHILVHCILKCKYFKDIGAIYWLHWNFGAVVITV